MREDIWNIGFQGGFGRGMDGMWTGSSVMRRRRWRRRTVEVEVPRKSVRPRPAAPPEASP